MIKARHHKIIYPIFKILTRFLIRWKFAAVTIDYRFNDNQNAILIIANHISWWDGFWLEYLNLRLLKRKLHFMMLEEQLSRHWYFRYSGGYSIRKNSRSMLESLTYTTQLLQKPENMVIMFPQGKISSMHTTEFKFQKGIERIVQHVRNETQVLFVANVVEYFSRPKPSLFIYAEGFTMGKLKNENLEQAYTQFYNQVLTNHKTTTC